MLGRTNSFSSIRLADRGWGSPRSTVMRRSFEFRRQFRSYTDGCPCRWQCAASRSHQNIPALGIQVGTTAPGAAAVGSNGLSVSESHMGNERLTITFDAKGRIVSILDKATGREAVTPGQLANRLVAFRDMPAQFDAWDIDESFEDQSWDIDDLKSVEIVETAPIGSLCASSGFTNNRPSRKWFSLEAEASTIEVDTLIDWKQKHTLVKAASQSMSSPQRDDGRDPVRPYAPPDTSQHLVGSGSFRNSHASLGSICRSGISASHCSTIASTGMTRRRVFLRLTLLRSPTYPCLRRTRAKHGSVMEFIFITDCSKVRACRRGGKLQRAFASLTRAAVIQFRRRRHLCLALKGVASLSNAVKKAETNDDLIIRLWKRKVVAQMWR